MAGCGKELKYGEDAYVMSDYPGLERRHDLFIHCYTCYRRIADGLNYMCIPGAAAAATTCGVEGTTDNFFAAANPLASISPS